MQCMEVGLLTPHLQLPMTLAVMHHEMYFYLQIDVLDTHYYTMRISIVSFTLEHEPKNISFILQALRLSQSHFVSNNGAM